MDSAPRSFPVSSWTVVRRARGGDSVAWSEIYKGYHEPLLKIARRDPGLSPEDAEDCVQAFFSRIASGQGTFEPDDNKGKLRSYLIGGLKNTIRTFLRDAKAGKRGGKDERASPDTLDDIAAPEDESSADLRDWAEGVTQRALSRLRAEYATPRQQQQFELLRPCLGSVAVSHPEIAQALGVETDSVPKAINKFLHRFGCGLRDEIAITLGDGAGASEIDEEFRQLRFAFERQGLGTLVGG